MVQNKFVCTKIIFFLFNVPLNSSTLLLFEKYSYFITWRNSLMRNTALSYAYNYWYYQDSKREDKSSLESKHFSILIKIAMIVQIKAFFI